MWFLLCERNLQLPENLALESYLPRSPTLLLDAPRRRRTYGKATSQPSTAKTNAPPAHCHALSAANWPGAELSTRLVEAGFPSWPFGIPSPSMSGSTPFGSPSPSMSGSSLFGIPSWSRSAFGPTCDGSKVLVGELGIGAGVGVVTPAGKVGAECGRVEAFEG